MADTRKPDPIVVMGVSGSGKSTIASMLAARLGWTYVDGDDLHPPANVAKMSAGAPLTDDDRWPWLRAIGKRIDTESAGVVVACSALKRAYRAVLREGREIRFVYLEGDRETIAPRLASRSGHYMPATLLESQFATLEPPSPDEEAIVVSIAQSPAAIVEQIATAVRNGARGTSALPEA